MIRNIDNIHYCCRRVEQVYFWLEDKSDYLDPDLENPSNKDRKKLQPIEGAGIASLTNITYFLKLNTKWEREKKSVRLK